MTRRLAAFTVALALLLGLLAAPNFLFVGDTADYVELGRAIAQGEPYAVNGRAETKFPPGFPAVLAPAALVLPDSFEAMSRWAAMLASLVFPLTYLWVRRRQPELAGPVAVLTVCSIPFLSVATGNPLSEPVYLAASLGLLLWADRWSVTAPAEGGWGWAAIGALLMVATVAIRTIGITAMGAGILFLLNKLWERRKTGTAITLGETLPLLAGLAFFAGWSYWGSLHAGSDAVGAPRSYLGAFLRHDPLHPELGQASAIEILGRLLHGVVIQAAHVGEVLVPVAWIKPLWYSPVGLLAAVVLAGWWKDLKSDRRFAAYYFAGYGGILLIWPYDEGARYLLPLAPLLWVYLAAGSGALLEKVRRRSHMLHTAGILWCATALAGFALTFRSNRAEISKQDLAAAAFWGFLLLLLITRWEWLARRLPGEGSSRRTWIRLTTAGLAVLAAVQAGPMILRRAAGRPPTEPVAREISTAAEWLAANTARSTRVETSYATTVHLATGRPTTLLPPTLDPGLHAETIGHFRPELLIVLEEADPYFPWSDRRRFAVLDSLLPGRLQLVKELPGVSIYAFR